MIEIPIFESKSGDVVVRTVVDDGDGETGSMVGLEVAVEPRAVSEAPSKSWRIRKVLKMNAVKRYWYLATVREWMRSWYRPGGRLHDGQSLLERGIKVDGSDVLAPRAW